MAMFFLHKIRGDKKKEKEKISAKEEYFLGNGAILLEKQVSLFQGKGRGTEPCKIFSAKDIERATNNYDHPLFIGRKIATVFKGNLDDRTVAIKVAIRAPAVEYPLRLSDTQWLVEFFLNQVAIKQVINHKHIVALHGCCLETEVPVLVFEFIPNGTLHDHLHGTDFSPISWPERVRIAAEVAQALAYVHCGTWKPIIHLDVKSSNVFLDENSTAKLSNFGYSVPMTPGEEYFQARSISGTYGYRDPEYEETLKINEKCDVYSFGVLLVELLTGSDPHELTLVGHARLADKFLSAMVVNRLLEIVHRKVWEEGDREEIEGFAKVAVRCLGKKGIDRPTMPEVALELRRIHHLVKVSRKLCLV